MVGPVQAVVAASAPQQPQAYGFLQSPAILQDSQMGGMPINVAQNTNTLQVNRSTQLPLSAYVYRGLQSHLISGDGNALHRTNGSVPTINLTPQKRTLSLLSPSQIGLNSIIQLLHIHHTSTEPQPGVIDYNGPPVRTTASGDHIEEHVMNWVPMLSKLAKKGDWKSEMNVLKGINDSNNN
eukprot:TRINITY_DN5137_c0_g1_i1.p1 TRINITY_DN5137_c0_g1~~TRINITY_DN5137_c0_g1_i1.p1  ORF type:complete len:201 (-),score=28.79 TRINITY_DN5137_c0_g1_i1:96-638(-)